MGIDIQSSIWKDRSKKCFSFIISFCFKYHRTAQNLSRINFVQCGGVPTMVYEGLKKKKVENQEI